MTNPIDEKNPSLPYFYSLVVFSIILNFLVLFIILLRWNLSGVPNDFDTISISLTVLEMFLFVVALGGFWMFRGIVKEKAEDVAKSVSEPIAKEIAQKTAEIVARRVAEEFQQGQVGAGQNNSPQDLADAMADDEEGK